MFKQIIAALTMFASGILITIGIIAIDESNIVQNAVKEHKQKAALKRYLKTVPTPQNR